jgi:DNA-binding FrmR family transcriptional regulator
MRCASGHLNAVIKMAEENEPCEQVLHQLHAVQASLNAIGLGLIACQIQDSQGIILDSSSAEERRSELMRIQSLYAVFTQYSNYHTEVSHD